MISFENEEFVGWETAIRVVRNLMNSCEQSDTLFPHISGLYYDINGNLHDGRGSVVGYCDLGDKDMELMMNLVTKGPGHARYRRMIVVYTDIIAPLYWWKEFDIYRIGEVANSNPMITRIRTKRFTLNDFSHEHLGVSIPAEKNDGEECFQNQWIETLHKTIEDLNTARDCYFHAKDPELKKKYWWQMTQLLPTSYNQRRTVTMNYEKLAYIYQSRNYYELDEWRDFCRWIEKLPYSKLITERKTESKTISERRAELVELHE